MLAGRTPLACVMTLALRAAPPVRFGWPTRRHPFDVAVAHPQPSAATTQPTHTRRQMANIRHGRCAAAIVGAVTVPLAPLSPVSQSADSETSGLVAALPS